MFLWLAYFTLAQCPQGLSVSYHISQFLSFLILSNSPLYGCTTFHLSIHLLMDIELLPYSSYELIVLWIVLLWTWVYRFSYHGYTTISLFPTGLSNISPSRSPVTSMSLWSVLSPHVAFNQVIILSPLKHWLSDFWDATLLLSTFLLATLQSPLPAPVAFPGNSQSRVRRLGLLSFLLTFFSILVSPALRTLNATSPPSIYFWPRSLLWTLNLCIWNPFVISTKRSKKHNLRTLKLSLLLPFCFLIPLSLNGNSIL